MRILLTTHQFFPQFAAGTEVLARSVARELIARGHVVHLLTGYPDAASLADEKRLDEFDMDGIHVYRFHHAYVPMGGQVSMIEIGYDNHLATAYFQSILEVFRPHIVHFFHFNRLGTGLIPVAVTAGIPCFMTPTDFWTICPTGQLLLGDGSICDGPNARAGNCLKHFAQSRQRGLVSKIADWLPTSGADLLVRLTTEGILPIYPKRAEVIAIAKRLPVNISRLNQLDGVIVPNGFMTDILVGQGVMRDLITEATFGIDVIASEKRMWHPHSGKNLRVGFIGTLAPHKGCHVAIGAIKSMISSGVTLKVFGSPEDFPEYASDLVTLANGIGAIEFLGTFPNSEIAKVFTDIDVLVIPSLWYENTPLVLYAAQAASCPVVASNLPGLTAVIEHEDNGLLFEPGSSVALAKQLSRLIEEDGLLQRLGQNARTPKSTAMYVDELLAVWATAR